MSVCDPEGGMHHLWGDVLPRQVFAPVPPGGFTDPPDDGVRGGARARRSRGTPTSWPR